MNVFIYFRLYIHDVTKTDRTERMEFQSFKYERIIYFIATPS